MTITTTTQPLEPWLSPPQHHQHQLQEHFRIIASDTTCVIGLFHLGPYGIIWHRFEKYNCISLWLGCVWENLQVSILHLPQTCSSSSCSATGLSSSYIRIREVICSQCFSLHAALQHFKGKVLRDCCLFSNLSVALKSAALWYHWYRGVFVIIEYHCEIETVHENTSAW